MLSLRAHSAFPTLFLAAGLCLAACSTKENTTALLVDVTLDIQPGDPVPIDAVVVVVTSGTAKFTGRFPWSDASGGTLKATLVLPAEAAGDDDTVDVQGTLRNAPATPTVRVPHTMITAGKAAGPIVVVLKPIIPIADGGADALPGDGPQPDLSAGAEAGKPDAGVTPDTGIDGPGAEVAVLDAPLLFDLVQPVDVVTSPDAPQVFDVAGAGADAPQPSEAGVDRPKPIEAGADAPQPSDAVKAGAEAGADSAAAPAWQPGEDVVNDPFDYASDCVVAVDPVRGHVYVMWIDWPSSAVRLRRWDALKAKWGDTYTLEENASGNPKAMQIGVDSAGNVIAAWFHWEPSDTTLLGVRSSQSSDGVSWSTPARITPNRQVAEASLAVARNGTARLAFTVWDSANSYVPLLYSAYYDGNTWAAGPDALAAQPNISSPPYPNPSVAISDQGGIILFTQKDAQLADSVAVATFAGPALDPYILLDTDVSNNIEERAVVMNRNGEAAVAWSDNGAMLSSYSPSNKNWTTPRKIGNAGLRQPTMVMASDGTITLAWSLESGPGYFNVWTMEGTASGAWTTPTALENDNLSIEVTFLNAEFGPLPSPTLAIDGADDVLLVWSKKTQAAPSPRQFAVYGRSKPAGSTGVWQPATELARKPLQPWALSLGVSDNGLGAAGYYWLDAYSNNDSASAQLFVSFFR